MRFITILLLQLVSEHLLHILTGLVILAMLLFGALQLFVYLDRRGKEKFQVRERKSTIGGPWKKSQEKKEGKLMNPESYALIALDAAVLFVGIMVFFFASTYGSAG